MTPENRELKDSFDAMKPKDKQTLNLNYLYDELKEKPKM